MAEVRLEHVTKSFENAGEIVHAVDDVTLAIPDREFMILLGPSGCGKSTLLRMVAGLEEPTSGDIFIGARRVNDVLPKERDVAMVFQSYALYPHKTVAANIEFPLKVRGVGKAERAAQGRAAAKVLGLEPYLGRKPGQLSGGQRQRVALARAMVRQPAVFAMDEPLSNLDAKMRAETRTELVDLHQRLDTTFIYVTHDQTEAMTMGSRVAVLESGRVQQVGTPQEVYARPATVFVAQFIGTPPMNVLTPGLLGRDSERIGVRPEHVAVERAGAAGDPDALAATVRLIEHLGHETLVFCLLDDATQVIARLPGGTSFEAGEAVTLAVPAGVRHRFDAASGERLT